MKRCETTASRDWVPLRWRYKTQNGRNGLTGRGTLFGAGRAKEVSLLSTTPACQHAKPSWRPPLLYANPLGHCVPATLFTARFIRNNMSGDHHEKIGTVAFGVSRLGGG